MNHIPLFINIRHKQPHYLNYREKVRLRRASDNFNSVRKQGLFTQENLIHKFSETKVKRPQNDAGNDGDNQHQSG